MTPLPKPLFHKDREKRQTLKAAVARRTSLNVKNYQPPNKKRRIMVCTFSNSYGTSFSSSFGIRF